MIFFWNLSWFSPSLQNRWWVVGGTGGFLQIATKQIEVTIIFLEKILLFLEYIATLAHDIIIYFSVTMFSTVYCATIEPRSAILETNDRQFPKKWPTFTYQNSATSWTLTTNRVCNHIYSSRSVQINNIWRLNPILCLHILTLKTQLFQEFRESPDRPCEPP